MIIETEILGPARDLLLAVADNDLAAAHSIVAASFVVVPLIVDDLVEMTWGKVTAETAVNDMGGLEAYVMKRLDFVNDHLMCMLEDSYSEQMADAGSEMVEAACYVSESMTNLAIRLHDTMMGTGWDSSEVECHLEHLNIRRDGIYATAEVEYVC